MCLHTEPGRPVDREIGCARGRDEPYRPGMDHATDDRRLAGAVTVHVAATMAMVGLMWTVHFVHYPLFAKVGAEGYPDYQSEHIDRIGAVLVLPWGLEGASIIAVLVLGWRHPIRRLAIAGVALMGLILLVTAVWAAPVHGELLDGFDAEQHDTLMNANLVRTILWTARGGIAVAMVWQLVGRRLAPADRIAEPSGV